MHVPLVPPDISAPTAAKEAPPFRWHRHDVLVLEGQSVQRRVHRVVAVEDPSESSREAETP